MLDPAARERGETGGRWPPGSSTLDPYAHFQNEVTTEQVTDEIEHVATGIVLVVGRQQLQPAAPQQQPATQESVTTSP